MSEMEKLAAMLSQKKLQQEQVKEDAENQYQQWLSRLRGCIGIWRSGFSRLSALASLV